MSNLKFAIRQLSKTPGFTGIAVVVLGLGIGANATIFSIINSILVKPLQVPHPEQLAGVYQHEKDNPDAFSHFSYADFADLRAARPAAFTDLFAFRNATIGLQGELTQSIPAEFVSGSYFSALGVPPALGRVFLPEEELSGAPVVVLAHSCWTRLGANPSIVGQQLHLSRGKVTVIGVMPRGFTGAQVMAPQMFFPVGMLPTLNASPAQTTSAGLADRGDRGFMVMGRLKSGVTLANAEQALGPLNQQLAIPDPADPKPRVLICRPPSRFNFSPQPSRPAEGLIPLASFASGLAILVLVVACLNLANMMFARGAARRTEIAIRLALGARSGQILRQLLMEGAVLAVLGGAAGLLISLWAANLLSVFIYSGSGMPADFPRFDLSPDWHVVLILLGLSGLATVLFALWPAWRMARAEVSTDLKSPIGNTDRTKPKAWLGMSEVLATAQVALSLALLAAAGLFGQSAIHVVEADPGFHFGSNFYLSLEPSMAGYPVPRARQFLHNALERLSTLAGVESVSAASRIPFGNSWDLGSIQIGGAPPPTDTAASYATGKELYAIQNVVGTRYFHTIGLPLSRGREFESRETEHEQAPKVVIISQSLADRFWPGQDPIGRSIQFPGAVPRLMTVVGVAPEVTWQLFQKEERPQIYLPSSADFTSGFKIHVRVAPGFSAAQIMNSARTVLLQLDPQIPLTEVKTLAALHRDSPIVRVTRFGSALFGAFGGLALLLSLLGIYALKSFAVNRRTREIGVRMALGANRREVVTLILKESTWLVASGLTLGLALALIVGRLARGFLYQVPTLDPLIFSVVPLLMLVTSFIACVVPARRAASLDPMKALRYE